MVASPAVKTEATVATAARAILEASDLQALFDALSRRGYKLIGPTMRDGAIVYEEIRTVQDLPAGWTDEQGGGTYRLKEREDGAYFGYTQSPQSWKRHLNPPVSRLWHAKRVNGEFQVFDEPLDETPRAFIGVRSCELHAIRIQDRVYMGDRYIDPAYQARREHTFIVAVNCTRAGDTCFCVSMGTGPKVDSGYDLAMTEVVGGDTHYFVVEAGSAEGEQVLAEIPHRQAMDEETDRADRAIEDVVLHMGRAMDTADIKELLYRNLESKVWDDVAARCLTCGNCTMVCPTCFCSTVEDSTDLVGATAERNRKWDSCFNLSYSYIHGGSVRVTPKSRYRQWMTHKLAYWYDQFGTSGCVGCGRCITWCPVGIDITKEVSAIRAAENAPATEYAETEARHADA